MKKKVETNIIILFKYNSNINRTFTLVGYKEYDLTKFINSSTCNNIQIGNGYIDSVTIGHLLKRHFYFDLGKRYLSFYVNKVMLIKEKKKIFSGLSKLLLSGATFKFEELEDFFENMELQENNGEDEINDNWESDMQNDPAVRTTDTAVKRSEEETNRRKNQEIKISGLTEGVILNNKNYGAQPAIGRENEIEKLIVNFAQSKHCPMLVGESGVGKTAIVDQLVYMIQNNKVPSF